MEIRGKTVVVTGGTDGIGRELAQQLEGEGATLIVVGRRTVSTTAAQPGRVSAIAADLSNAAGCDHLLAALDGISVDVLVNNAGVDPEFSSGGPIDRDALDRAIYLNLQAPVRLIAGLLPVLLARPAARIVNVTSGLAIAGSASTPVYCGSKAGLRHFTLALREQLRGTPVGVLEVLPPMVDTAMTQNIDQAGKMTPKACAIQIVDAIRSDAKEANIGQVRLLRAIYSLSPALARRIMLRS